MKNKIKNKKVKKKSITYGKIIVQASLNNTFVVLTDFVGNVLLTMSAGMMFKGSKKQTAYAGQVVMAELINRAMAIGLQRANIEVKGAGPSRDSALKAIPNSLEVVHITDSTPIAHNGCRAKKKRRN